MAILDLDGRWIQVNKSLCDIFGYDMEDLKGMSFLEMTHPEGLKSRYKAVLNMKEGLIENYKTEKRYIGKSGNPILTLLSTTLIKDSDGNPQHFLAQLNDLTEIKKNRDKVQELLATTENQNKRLLNFAHIVSHNLRSHHGNLEMLIDLTKADYPESTDNEIFSNMEDAISNLGETVENLNEVASINIKNKIEVEPLNLLTNLENALGTISGLILDSNTKITNTVNSKMNVMAIPAYLDSILLNFLTNAIKYKKPKIPAIIEISAEELKREVILKIKDYGLGIDLKTHGEKLFGMYKTFHKHKDSRGLGLFITKNQVEALGGRIEVESEIGIGTTFQIYFKSERNI